jgi:hypothetical protein
MPGRGKSAGRKRKMASPTTEAAKTPLLDPDNEHQDERLDLFTEADAPELTTRPGNQRVIDFETIISESMAYPKEQMSASRFQNNFDDMPEMIRCGGDKLGCHVPEQIKNKIKQNEYVNLAVLLKGGVELTEMQQGSILGIDENGHIIAKSKAMTERVSTIEQWSDAFLIFSSIYLSAHQELTQDILHYMFVIREAAYKYGGLFWRTYDEQFRLRQASQFMPWSSINSDLWLRCFSGVSRPFTPCAAPSTAPTKPPPCIDFNKGYCKWSNCRYPHVCSVCSTPQHGRWNCRSGNHTNTNQPTYPFRGSFRGQQSRSNWRGQPRGAFRGKKS